MRLNQDLIQRMFDGRGGASGGGSSLDPGLINGMATEMWTEENYVSKTFFNELFVIHKKTTTTVYDGDTVVSTTTDTSGTFAPNEIPSQEESTDEETGYRTVVVTEVDNIEAKKGLWTDFFLSALGLNGSGGGGGIGDVTWQALGDNTDTRQIASSHLTTALGSALAGYATQSWVTSQNYVTSSAISDMATKTWVNNQSFVNWTALGDTTTTQQIALSHLTTALSGYATQTWVTNNFSTPSSVATQMQTYAKIQNGTITIGDTSITPITSVTGTFWGKSFTNGGTVNGTIKAGSNGGAIEQFHSVEMNSAGTLSGYGGFIDFHYYATGSTFDSSLDYTSRIIESEVGVISILAKNNNATNANKMAGLLVGDGYDGSYVQIGNIRIVYDSTNNALKVVKLVSGSEVAANFYATGSVSALGYGAGGGGGTGDVTWTNLADNTDTRQIALSHLTGALSGYATTSQLAGYLPLTGGVMNANAVIQRTGTALYWYEGRNNPMIKTTSYVSASRAFNSILSMKTSAGSWDMGIYDGKVYLNYITDSDYNASRNNVTYQLDFPLSTGTIATEGYVTSRGYITSSGSCAYATSAGSVAQLTNARTIWGQSFDGTGNVDGKLTISTGAVTLDSPLISASASSTSNNSSLMDLLCPTLGDGEETNIFIGKSKATANSIQIKYKYSSSKIPLASIGFYGQPFIINFKWDYSDQTGPTTFYSVGIGTYTPSYKLHVGGTFGVNGDAYFGGDIISSSIKNIIGFGGIELKGDSESGMGGHIDFHYQGSTGYTSRIIEDASGIINIPSGSLCITYNKSTESSAVQALLSCFYPNMTVNDLAVFRIGKNNDYRGNYGQIVYQYAGNDNAATRLSLGFFNNYYFHLYNSGNVGIDVSSPTEKLEVNGNVKATAFKKDGGTSAQFLKADGSIDSNTYATTTQLGDYLPLTGGTLTGNDYEVLRIKSTNSNIGSSYIAFETHNISFAAAIGYNNGIAFVANQKNGSARIGVLDDGTPVYMAAYNDASPKTLYHTGNLPAYLLLAGGTMDAGAIIKRTGKGGQWIKGRDYALLETTTYDTAGFNPVVSMKVASGSWDFGVYDGRVYLDYMTDSDYSGNQNTPTYQLEFPQELGHIIATREYMSNTGSASKLTTARTIWGQSFDGSANVSGAMSSVTNIDALLYFDTTNSRLGVGTSSPSYNLHVAGTFYASGAATLGSTLSVTGATTLSSTLEVTGAITATGGVIGNASSATKLQTARNIWGKSFDGTADVDGVLSIRTNTTSSHNFFNAYSTLNTNQMMTMLFGRQNETGNAGQIIFEYVANNSSSNRLYLGFYNNYSVFTVTNGGKVGIGQTSPAYKLDVNGSFNASGDTLLGSNVSNTTTVYHKMVVGETNYTNNPYIQIGMIRLVYNNTDNAIRVVRSDGTAANLYATGGISALGYQSGGGGGGSTGVFSTSITPDTTGVYDLGTSTYKWRNLYLAGANGGNGFSIITTYNSYVYIGSVGKVHFGSSDVEFEDTVYVENRLGIGTKNGNYDLYVYGENEGNAYFKGDVSVASLTNRSDMRLKDVVGDVNLSVQQIASAPTFKFRFKEKAKRTMVGTSAQYWDAVLPESVTRDADGILGLDYGVTALVSTIILAKGMTEHERRITKLEMENAELRARIKDLEEN